jgi:TonB family protein
MLRRFCLLLLLASALPALAQATCGVPKNEMLRPIMSTHTLPPYPPQAVRNNEQGQTMLQVTISPDGIPTAAAVTQSSSSTQLDSAAASHITRYWRWNTLDCPQDRVTRVSIKWDLKDAPDEPKESRVVTYLATAALALLGMLLHLGLPRLWKMRTTLARPRLPAPQLSEGARLNLKQTISAVLLLAGIAAYVLIAYGLAKWLNW